MHSPFCRLPWIGPCLAALMIAGGSTWAESRPTVGLALGGGGALGYAHIGVLCELEALRIPIDYIAGTSMGAIVGGLYASGMSPDQIADHLAGQDWWTLLEDETDRQDLDFRRKQEDRRFLLDFEIGLRRFRPVLPEGLAAGQRLNNELQAVTTHVAHIDDFEQMNIPFRCAAVDINSGELVVLRYGNLAKAIRASMALPVIFTPVRIDDHVLVDGGLLLNLPVDVVKKMGADVVIAVDVVGNAPKWSPTPSMATVLGRTITVMQKPSRDEQQARADVVLAPPTEVFGPGDFHKVRDIAGLGAEYTQSKTEALASLAVDPDTYRNYLQHQRSVTTPPSRILSIRVEGESLVDKRIIKRRITTRRDDAVDFQTLQRDANRIYGLGDFQNVDYRLDPFEDGYALQYQVREKHWGPGYIRFGLNLETDFDNQPFWSLLVNYTRTRINSLGLEWRTELRTGRDSALTSDLYQPVRYDGLYFVRMEAGLRSERQDLFDGKNRVSDYGVERAQVLLGGGLDLPTYGQIEGGYLFAGIRSDVESGFTDALDADDVEGAVVIKADIDRLDDALFPGHGFYVELQFKVAREALGGDFDYDKGSIAFGGAASVGNHTLNLEGGAGSGFGSDLPLYEEFTLGGIESIAGLPRERLRGPYIAFGSLMYRYRIARLPPGLGHGLYLAVRGDAGNAWTARDQGGTDDVRYSGGGGMSADTKLGALQIGYARADQGEGRAYFAIGSDF